MDFWLSKLLWALVAPASLLVLALVLGVAALWTPWPGLRRFGRWLLSLTAVLLVMLALFPFERLYLEPLEQRFPPPELPAELDGIVVLGGGISFMVTDGRTLPQLNDSGGDRLAALQMLALRYPEAKLVFSGGSGFLRDPELREADGARQLLADLGFPVERVLWERRSRNTWENALFSKELAAPQPGERWLLVTSAFHMPRAVGCFRALGWEVLAYPVDYQTRERDWLGFDVDPLYALATLTVAGKEWIGLAAYYLMDRSPSLFPAP